jgi:endonuclease/exonuclease/phosphatase family metal-dependent hydrolase
MVKPSKESSENFKVLVLNAENLFIFMEHWKDQDLNSMTEREWQSMNAGFLDNKPISKIRNLAHSILQMDPDLIMLTEVGGPVSLENFNQHFLQNKWNCYLEEGNSERGIDIGYLLKSPWTAKLSTHRDYKLPHTKYNYFSRDVLKLEISLGDDLWFHSLLVHLKSKLNSKGDDFEGRTRRAVEVLGLSEIIYQLDSSIPLLLGGDFNGDARWPMHEPEFSPLYAKNNLKDVAALSTLSDDEKFSYIYFNRSGQRLMQQIDYLFLNDTAQDMLIKESVIFPQYVTVDGQSVALPQQTWQKILMPSDHLPLYAEFDLRRHKHFQKKPSP